MAKNGKKNDRYEKKVSLGLKTQTKHGIIAVIFFVFALFFLMAYFDAAGKAGTFAYEKLYLLLGVGYILLPTLLILLGSSFIKSEVPDIGWTRVASGILFLLSGLGMIDIASGETSSAGRHAGGFFGEILSRPFVSLFDIYASLVFLGAILIISILIMFDAKFDPVPFFEKIWAFVFKKKEREEQEEKVEDYYEEQPPLSPLSGGVEVENETYPDKGRKEGFFSKKKKEEPTEEEDIPIRKIKSGLVSTYVPPPLSLLEEYKGKPNTGDIKANSESEDIGWFIPAEITRLDMHPLLRDVLIKAGLA